MPSGGESSDPLKDWNPMRDAYNDSKFNKYMSGPGAELDDSLQPSECPKTTNGKATDPYLVFQNVPENLTLNGLINICTSYGKVLRGKKHDTHMYFINFPTVNDMERVFTNLQNNSYGFRVLLGKKVNRDSIAKIPKFIEYTDTAAKSKPFVTNEIDYDRSYSVSTFNPPRPSFEEKPIVSKEDYENPDNSLSKVDPQRHFLIKDDDFELERLEYNTTEEIFDGDYSFHLGRAYYRMAQREKQLIEEKRKTSSGFYEPTEEKYLKKSPISKQAKVGKCLCCQSECAIVCSRCSAFFCSIQCQKKEWKKHRKNCGKPPEFKQSSVEDELEEDDVKELSNATAQLDLSSPSGKNEQPALQAQMPHNGCNVQLTTVSKTNVVFVRSKTFDDNLKFFETVSSIQQSGRKQKPIKNIPKRGEIVITKFTDDQYNRGMILNPDNPDAIKLVYVDYGNIDVKPMKELLTAPKDFWRLPRMALPIVLKDVPEVFMTEEIKKFMYSYLNKELKIVYQEEQLQMGIHSAELFDVTTNVSFNKMIKSLIPCPKEASPGKLTYFKDVEYGELPTGENVVLLILDNSLLHTSFISCTTMGYMPVLQKIQRDVQKYITEMPSTEKGYTPRVNELCLVKYTEDEMWYRGRCLELVGDGFPSILYIDYGNVAIVSMDNIRRYPEEFKFPVMVRDCEVQGLPKLIPKALQKKLEETLKSGTEITCERVDEELDGSYKIYIPEILKQVFN